MARAERSGVGRACRSRSEPGKKKKFNASAAWREARELLWAHRRRLAIGLALMLVSAAWRAWCCRRSRKW